jgi:hypothetical protein
MMQLIAIAFLSYTQTDVSVLERRLDPAVCTARVLAYQDQLVYPDASGGGLIDIENKVLACAHDRVDF